MPEKKEVGRELIVKLRNLLDQNKDKRVVVIGTTCTGKSTFLKDINTAHDIDELVFPQLTKAERDYVCQTPWTPEIGQTMTRLVKEKIRAEPGKPIFGTVMLDSDIIIYLQISDELLAMRTRSRNVNFQDAKNMQERIEAEIKKSQIPVIVFSVG